jgi:hypothetical protein
VPGVKIACQVAFRLADLAWMNGQKQILDAVAQAVGGSCACSVGAALCMAHLQLRKITVGSQ